MVLMAASTARSTRAARLRGRSGMEWGVGEGDLPEVVVGLSLGRRVCSGEDAVASGVMPVVVWEKMKGRPTKMSLR